MLAARCCSDISIDLAAHRVWRRQEFDPWIDQNAVRIVGDWRFASVQVNSQPALVKLAFLAAIFGKYWKDVKVPTCRRRCAVRVCRPFLAIIPLVTSRRAARAGAVGLKLQANHGRDSG